LTLEEPESHLYPSAIRMLWHLLTSLDAQLIITTHSGDLLSETPLRCIRRISQTQQGASVHRIDFTKFTQHEIRQLEYGIQATRGEILFANAWLIVEGRTEFVGLKRLAWVLGIDLHAAGVRIVECQQLGGAKPFIKLADELGIAWHLPNEKRSSIVAAPGTEDYANQIGGAVIESRKERAILEVCTAVEAQPARAPELFRLLLQTCCRLARR
jgi:hypothetical protein